MLKFFNSSKLLKTHVFRIYSTKINIIPETIQSDKKINIYDDEYHYRYACAHLMYMTLSEYEKFCGLKPLFHNTKIK